MNTKAKLQNNDFPHPPGRRTRFDRAAWLVPIMLAAVCILAGLSAAAQPPDQPDRDALQLAEQEKLLARQISNVFRRAVERVMPAVVHLKVSRSFKAGLIPTQPQTENVGSGCIIDPRGYIITCNHVVSDNNGEHPEQETTRVEVILADGRRFVAQQLLFDPDTDLALVKIEPGDQTLPLAEFGDSDNAQVGDLVLAIGNPFGLNQTVTSGIVSYKGRQTHILGDWGYEDFIQTDAQINQGNSGGPLVNLYGQVIGINSNIFTPHGFSAGYGFAVPSSLAKFVVKQLIENQQVKRGWLGVKMIGLDDSRKMPHQQLHGIADPDFQKFLRTNPQFPQNIPETVQGAYVFKVVPASPAERAKIQPGDIFLELNGRKITASRQLRNLVGTLTPGTPIQALVWRDGREQEVEIILDDRDDARSQTVVAADDGKNKGDQTTRRRPPLRLAIEVRTLNTYTARQFGYQQKDIRQGGVIIVEVKPGGLGQRIGLQVGDIVVSVNGRPVRTVRQLKAIIDQADPSKGDIELKIRNRQGEQIRIIKDPAV